MSYGVFGAWCMEPSEFSLFTPSPPPFNPSCFTDTHKTGFKTPTTAEAQRSVSLTRVGQDVRLRHRNADDIHTNIVLIRRFSIEKKANSIRRPDSRGNRSPSGVRQVHMPSMDWNIYTFSDILLVVCRIDARVCFRFLLAITNCCMYCETSVFPT